ncbi:3-hydroxyacyl-CoA dehydrogenase NAD-binding domain-containing protein [Paracoccus denitrificans]|jgi:3-hydroxyacyl-CoA dehydrogenase|uniref:3-hydroxyacyl-CoA dehydrogenase n=1 Tax=Paracoccus denitrificans (strain Pd 1222) TaxID=318586 RepID=A1AYH1_PARDP|nr:3-hydroxyacyl-CoA dehydrogenase NAD-binding domain-containing protein [Paracoccus denitrificans]ABL68315.1 3-hydroxyacyl-CoA dehydrogenase [Paracoccus denitrificans PD1222]MBB4627831.1 3-hydroxyacyl-CoA dehydrogenase [Paracoccus denitrificans]MCU7428634.1 3-hydroxyacyl-CoA dehydrogenase NAD-binding domain-containing protein [Paracoccus denitrificans]QAR26404.1 FAD-dependent oxidoreductase [Paracoccus denitrificans]UPV95334.1 3-hydroxyacyl-CoA dehydrogenase NAD-binding domain-containing prot
MPVHYDLAGDSAVLTFDNPPLNVLGQAMRADLARAIAQAAADRPARLILRGAGRNFVAGADAREFDGPPLDPQLNEVLDALAALPFPTIAAIHGAALGGGLEIALACRFRIAHPSATLGLPEVTLGIVPGAGGTQRLPRLVGMAAALDLLGQGRSVTAAEAESLGLIDLIADDPMAAARGVDTQTLLRALCADDRPPPAPDEAAVAAAHARADRRAPGQVAPHRAIELVATSAQEPIKAALTRERATFLDLRGSDQARALRHVFFAERAAMAQGKAWPAPAPEIARAVVVGGGNMGAAIAYALLSAGLVVRVVETDAAALDRARDNIAGLVAQGRKRGALTDAGAAELQARLSLAVGYDDLPAADLAIEAAYEDMAVKQAIFAALQDALPDSTILATNTSYLDIDLLAQGIRQPGRFLGLHFFAPAHVMKLLEIVRGEATSDQTLGAAFRLARKLGKVPVLAGVCDGFIGNRILARYRHAADILLLEGALPAQVDAAMRGFGMAMGPYEAQDMSGLDIAYANRRRQNLRDRADHRYVPIADHLVERCRRLGRKSGAGWYDYDAEGRAQPSDEVTQAILSASRDAGITRVALPAEGIAERLVLAMIAEATRILAEGIAAAPRDIDLVLVHGYGFPRWRGGLMHHADRLTPARILSRIEALAKDDPLSWSVPPLLRQLADEGRDFTSLNPSA